MPVVRARAIRDVLAAAGICAATTLASCIGVPVYRDTFQHVLATAWSKDGGLVILAQEVRLGKTAWLTSPEGPGVAETFHPGNLLLLESPHSIKHRIPLEKDNEEAMRAFEFADGTGFVVLTTQLIHSACHIVSNDGTLSACSAPDGYQFDPGGSHFLKTTGELLSRQRHDTTFRFEALDVRTGSVRALDDDFLGLRLRSQFILREKAERLKPCSPEMARLSPAEDRWLIACPRAEGLNYMTDLWVLRRDLDPALIYTSPAVTRDEIARQSYRAYQNRRPRDEYLGPRERFGLAWSADGSAVYWCGSGDESGVIAYLDGRPPIPGMPCLTVVSWSPDGTHLAGVKDGEVVIWDIHRHTLQVG